MSAQPRRNPDEYQKSSDESGSDTEVVPVANRQDNDDTSSDESSSSSYSDWVPPPGPPRVPTQEEIDRAQRTKMLQKCAEEEAIPFVISCIEGSDDVISIEKERHTYTLHYSPQTAKGRISHYTYRGIHFSTGHGRQFSEWNSSITVSIIWAGVTDDRRWVTRTSSPCLQLNVPVTCTGPGALSLPQGQMAYIAKFFYDRGDEEFYRHPDCIGLFTAEHSPVKTYRTGEVGMALARALALRLNMAGLLLEDAHTNPGGEGNPKRDCAYYAKNFGFVKSFHGFSQCILQFGADETEKNDQLATLPRIELREGLRLGKTRWNRDPPRTERD